MDARLLVIGVIFFQTISVHSADKDVIWFPDEERDGVFVSNYGERYRTVSSGWNNRIARFTDDYLKQQRSHSIERSSRSARYFLPLSETKFYQVFLKNSDLRNSRSGPQADGPPDRYRYFKPNPPQIQKPTTRVPPPETTTQNLDVFSDIFDIHRTTERGIPQTEFSTTSGSPFDLFSGQTSEWGWSTPTTSEWNDASSGNPGNPNAIFFGKDHKRTEEGYDYTSTTISPFETTTKDCESSCLTTGEHNPVCGSDAENYSNPGKLKCAQMCGKDVEFVHYGNCGRNRQPVTQRTRPTARQTGRRIPSDRPIWT